MKISTIILIYILFMGCATDYRGAQVKAVRHLKNYDLSEIDLNPVIITVDTRDYIPGRKTGFYDEYHQEILILKNCPGYVLTHEYEHSYLSQIGISADLHHNIIN